ncbi:hypothetical protein JOF56_009354 [Kibdelosporangium banguiense]|uniref:Uncharacterized protein n=1 Tax=Kibdelosporangium banguiense TaxID=1365924 RepID=A0ABS4TX54_9PSEU|nr:hypothetical protein [Kibdelosporangium banguiense]
MNRAAALAHGEGRGVQEHAIPNQGKVDES